MCGFICYCGIIGYPWDTCYERDENCAKLRTHQPVCCFQHLQVFNRTCITKLRVCAATTERSNKARWGKFPLRFHNEHQNTQYIWCTHVLGCVILSRYVYIATCGFIASFFRDDATGRRRTRRQRRSACVALPLASKKQPRLWYKLQLYFKRGSRRCVVECHSINKNAVE